MAPMRNTVIVPGNNNVVKLYTLILGIARTTHSPYSFSVGFCMRNASVICREKLLPPHA
jgi:hypothetical protein